MLNTSNLSIIKKTPHSLKLCGLIAILSAITANAQGKKVTIDSNFKLKAAEQIDSLINQSIRKKGLPIPEATNDEKYLRRIYLTVAGRIPSLEEIIRYKKNRSPYKREIIAQQLINSDGYRSSMTNYFFDLLRVNEKFERYIPGAPYQKWIRDSVNSNKKWNEFAHQLVSSQGSIWNNGAVGYHIRDRGMRLDGMAMSVRLFNGTSMECAQCHDHPHNEIERMDFYKLAAFSEGMEPTSGAAKILGKLVSEERNRNYAIQTAGKRPNKALFQLFKRTQEVFGYTSFIGKAKGTIALPKDYQYSDGKPKEVISGVTPFENIVKTKKAENNHSDFSTWLTTNNKRFTNVIANRMWKRVMGTAIYEPVDEFVDPKKTPSPKLTAYLSELMLAVDYDLKEFQHILLLTQTFGAETSEKSVRAKYYLQNGRQLNRMTAEQIWDSFITIKEGNPDKLPKRSYENTFELSNVRFGPGHLDVVKINKAVNTIKNKDEMRAYMEELLTSKAKGKKNNNDDMMMMSSEEKNTKAPSRYSRASELNSPENANHMLRKFGQSDRAIIENGDSEANVPQVLSMLNGYVEKVIVADRSATVYSNINSKNSVEQNITNLFLSTLTREPSDIELTLFKGEIESQGEKGYKNILSALLTSREFIFVQ